MRQNEIFKKNMERHELAVHEVIAAKDAARHFTVPATEFAMEFIGRPLPNAALLGARAPCSRPSSRRFSPACQDIAMPLRDPSCDDDFDPDIAAS